MSYFVSHWKSYECLKHALECATYDGALSNSFDLTRADKWQTDWADASS